MASGRAEKEAGSAAAVCEKGTLLEGREAGCLGGRSAAVERLSAERLSEVPPTLPALASELLKPTKQGKCHQY